MQKMHKNTSMGTTSNDLLCSLINNIYLFSFKIKTCSSICNAREITFKI